MRQIKMYSNLKALVIVLALCLVSTSAVIGQTQVCDEDFESVTPGNIPEDNPTGAGEISVAGRPFYGHEASQCDGAFLASGGHPGQCAMGYVQSAYINNNSYTSPKWRFDNSIGGGREAYVKFSLRVGADLGTSNGTREINTFKFCMITSHTDASAGADARWHPQLIVEPSSSSYNMYTWSDEPGTSNYYFTRSTTKGPNHLMDNNWHTYEIYFHIGTAIVDDQYDDSADGTVRMWEDGVLILEDTRVPFRGTASEGTGINSIGFIKHAKSLNAPVFPMSGHLYFDNFEVWNAMPGGSGGDTTPPDPPQNVDAEAIVDP